MRFLMPAAPVLLALLLAPQAAAQEPDRIDFADGAFTITETDDGDRILAFNDKELARDYFISLDKIADVGGTEVAFFSVGPGGNACAPNTLMAWMPEGEDVRTASLGEDCGSPSAAISNYGVFFVPYLLPGDTAEVRAWTPDDGFSLQGMLSYAPDPGSNWASFDPKAISHPMDVFRNADIYAAAQALLGTRLTDVVTGLSVAASPDVSASGLLSARGCVPHACTMADTFIVVDAEHQAIFLAQQDEPRASFWPARDMWPARIAALIPRDF